MPLFGLLIVQIVKTDSVTLGTMRYWATQIGESGTRFGTYRCWAKGAVSGRGRRKAPVYRKVDGIARIGVGKTGRISSENFMLPPFSSHFFRAQV